MAFAPTRRKRMRGQAVQSVGLIVLLDVMVVLVLFIMRASALEGRLLETEVARLPELELPGEASGPPDLLVTQRGVFCGIDGFSLMKKSEQEKYRVVRVSVLNNRKESSAELEEYFRDKCNDLKWNVKERLVIQSDASVPYEWMMKVVTAAQRSGIVSFEFVAVRGEANE